MEISIIHQEEIKIKEQKKRLYGKEYRESTAKSRGFESHDAYVKYFKKKREERLKEITKRIENEKRKLEELKKEGQLDAEKEKKEFIERKTLKEELLHVVNKKNLCKSLQKIASEVKDPESIFKDNYGIVAVIMKRKIKRRKWRLYNMSLLKDIVVEAIRRMPENVTAKDIANEIRLIDNTIEEIKASNGRMVTTDDILNIFKKSCRKGFEE